MLFMCNFFSPRKYSFLIIGTIVLMACMSCASNRDLKSSVNKTRPILEKDIEYLASDDLEGRATGTEGEKKAADYIADRFSKSGVDPKGEAGYFQDFSVMNKDNPHDISFGSEGQGEITVRNVIGFIDNNKPTTVVLGAHYDHLGYGEFGSLHTGSPEIHNGADDNASGVAALLWLADNLKRQESNHNYLFIAFSGEEHGLWGSNYFMKNPTIEPESITFMVNMDMVGRLNDEKQLAIHGTGTSPQWNNIIENVKIKGVEPVLKEGGVGPSDHTSFYLEGIPVLHFFTGQHQDYHRPSDDEERINYEGLNIVSHFILSIINQTDEIEKLTFSKTKDEDQNRRVSFNVTLGIVPDYLYSGEGLRIDGVREGRPADMGGIMKGDIVLEMGEEEVKDMNSYMQLLSVFKPGQTIDVKIDREGKNITKSVTFD